MTDVLDSGADRRRSRTRAASTPPQHGADARRRRRRPAPTAQRRRPSAGAAGTEAAGDAATRRRPRASQRRSTRATDAPAAEPATPTAEPTSRPPARAARSPDRGQGAVARRSPSAVLGAPAADRRHPARRRRAAGREGEPAGRSRPSPSARKRRRGGDGGGQRRPQPGAAGAAGPCRPATPSMAMAPVELDEETLERRRGRERKGRPVGRYLMCVHVTPELTQIAVLEGRNLIEHYVSRPADDVGQIHGNIYLGRVQNVLPGMEAAFVDIGTPEERRALPGRRAVRRRGHRERTTAVAERPRIEQMLKAKQMILCQVTKNPIGAKGARLTQEVSLPGRFVVLIPNSRTYGISKRLPDDERKRLRSILDRVKPAEHGVIVRTAAENVTEEELGADVRAPARASGPRSRRPAKQASGPGAALPRARHGRAGHPGGVQQGVPRASSSTTRACTTRSATTSASISPTLADRVEHYDAEAEGLPLFERFHVHEQLHKALDRKVWLPSGGSLIIEHTEALTVIDVNTGQERGHVEPRGDGLPQQPGGGRRDRPPAAPARHRRHHRHRLHRHGDPGEPPEGGGGLPGRAGPGQDPDAGVRHLRARAWSR